MTRSVAPGPRTGPIVAGALLALATACATPAPAAAQDAPGVSGAAPDLPSYPHDAVRRSELGSGPRSYSLFEPAEPAPEVAPVVVFLHGWLAVNPGAYGAWIEHLARSGKVVVFPRYQHDLATRPMDFLPNAIAAVGDALDVLDTSPTRVRPDRSRFALMGHSAGGNLAALMAASAADHGLPAPRAVVALLPGEVHPVHGPSLEAIPAATLLVVVTGEHDRIVGDLRARRIFAEATAVPRDRKKFILYRTDRHGLPWLVADHFAPTASHRDFDNGDGLMRSFQMSQGEVNALDRSGFWRLADLTFAAAFSGKTLDAGTDGGALFRRLGYWSDGRAVLPPYVADDLSQIPRILPAHGIRLFPWPAPAAIEAPARLASDVPADVIKR